MIQQVYGRTKGTLFVRFVVELLKPKSFPREINADFGAEFRAAAQGQAVVLILLKRNPA